MSIIQEAVKRALLAMEQRYDDYHGSSDKPVHFYFNDTIYSIFEDDEKSAIVLSSLADSSFLEDFSKFTSSAVEFLRSLIDERQFTIEDLMRGDKDQEIADSIIELWKDSILR